MAEAVADPTIFTVGGAVQASQGVYLPRQADTDLLAWCRAGLFAYVLSPRQLGKSSLMIHTAEALAADGIRTVLLDLTALGTGVTAEEWYFGLLYEMSDQLGLTTDPAAWWAGQTALGLTQRFTRFFQDVVLAEIAAPVVVFVDEIDTTLSLPFTDDFFAAIRSCHDARARVPEFARLSFVLIGVATPGDLIHDAKRTPFNIGRRVEMTDFTPAEAAPLAAGLGLPPAEATRVLGWALAWTGGHPYLTQRLCQALTAEARPHWTAGAVAEVVRRLFLGERSGSDNNLQFVRDMLTKRAGDPAAVLALYEAVLRGHSVPDEEQSLAASHLKLAGIVRREGATLHVRNRIYRTVFGSRWVRVHRPARVDWVLWLRRATVALGVAFVASVIGLGLLAEGRRREAESARTLAEARELAIRAQTAPDPEVGLLLASEAERQLLAGSVPDPNGGIAAVLGDRLAASHVRRRLVHPGPVAALAWSPDGSWLATGDEDGAIRVWDAATSGLRRTLWGHSGRVAAVAVSPDGRSIASAGADGTVRRWDATTGAEVAQHPGHTAEVLSLAYSADGSKLVSASRDGSARIWPGNLIDAWDQDLRGHSGWVRSAAFSPDGRRIVTAGADGTARLWDAVSGAAGPILRDHHRDVRGAVFSPSGRLIATVSEDHTLRLWDATTGAAVRGPLDAGIELMAVAFRADEQTVIASGSDGTVYAWDVASGAAAWTLIGHSGAVNGVAVSPDGTLLATAGADSTARLWALNGGAEAATLHHTGRWAGVLPATQGTGVLLIGRNGTLQAWDTQSAPLGPARQLVQGNVYAVVALSAGRFAVLTDNELRLLRADGTPAAPPVPQSGFASALAADPAGHWIATSESDGTVRLWDGAGGGPGRVLLNHQDAIPALAARPDGALLAVGSSDGTVWLGDPATGTGHTLPAAPGSAIRALAYSPNGQLLAAGAADGTVRLWDSAGGLRRVLPGAGGAISGLAWTPDGSRLVSIADDGLTRAYPLDPAGLLTLAQQRATRSLTAAEREQLGLFPTAVVPAVAATAEAFIPPPPSPTVPPSPTYTPPPVGPSPTPPPPPSGHIAFASNRGDPLQSHIYTLDSVGGNLRVLTSAPLYNLYPDWSPDGTRLVYMVADPKNTATSPAGDLWMMRADGGGKVALTHSLNAKWPRWSPNGDAIVYADAPENRADSYDLYLYILADRSIRRLTDAPGFDGFPSWTPDGLILFASTRLDGRTHLFRMNADGTTQRPLLVAPGEQENPSVSPDGRRIAFVSTGNGEEHLYTMARDGSDLRPLTEGSGVDRYPTWSPDSRWIAYHSNRADGRTFDLYRVPAAGGPPVRLTTAGADDDEPAWR